MIIGINASYLAKKEKTGVENFSSHLILQLLKHDSENKYFLFSNAPIPKNILPVQENFELFVSPFPRGWHRFRLPLSLLRHKVDLFFDPGYTVPPFISIPTIAFVHDLAFKYFPKSYSESQLRTITRAFSMIQKKAGGIVFSSNSARQDFDKYYADSRAKKQTIYQSFDVELFVDSLKTTRDVLKLTEKYLLFVGRLETKKNIVSLIRAYSQLRHKHPKITHKLVLVGKPGYGYADIKREINNNQKFKKDIIELGYAKDSDLPHIYQDSDAFIFPSLYEGFGIPLLEAFYAKTPVVCSGVSSLPEVAGDAAIYFDPKNPENIADKLFELISNPKIKSDLIKKGQQRLHLFSWENYCSNLLKFIGEINK